jgi:hypothetical protein
MKQDETDCWSLFAYFMIMIFMACLPFLSSNASEDRHSRYAQICAANGVERLALIETLPGYIGSDKETQERRKETDWCDLAAQEKVANSARWSTISAWFITILTLIGVIFLARTLVYTRRTLDEAEKTVRVTREIGYSQVRAYVRIKEIIFDIYGLAQISPDKDGIFNIYCKPKFENLGITPATNLGCTCRYIFNHHTQKKTYRTKFSKHTLNVSNLASGESTMESNFVISGSFAKQDFIGDAPDVIQIQNTDIITIDIVFWYNDVFEKTWFFKGIFHSTIWINKKISPTIKLDFKPIYSQQHEQQVEDPMNHLESLTA